YATARDLLVVPFGVLTSVVGVEWLVAWRHGLGAAVAALLISSIPIQFGSFAVDYFTDYQKRSAYRLDSVNMRAAADYVIASDRTSHVPAVYLSRGLGTGKSVQWKFHLVKNQQTDLWQRSHYFEAE